MKILVVVNPRAGSGKARSTADALCQALRGKGIAFEREESENPRDGSRLARSHRARDASVVAAVGGDGTFNEVCQALVDEAGRPAAGPDLCLVPAGTGSDLGRTLGLERRIDRVVERLMAAPRRVDLGVVQHGVPGGTLAVHAFLNVASAGFSAVVAKRSNGAPKWLGGRLTYLGASLATALTHQNAPLTITKDGERVHEGPVRFVAFCNGRFFGGGMHIAPSADPGDGQLECVIVGDLSKLETYALSTHIYEGTHVTRHGVSVCRGGEFEVACSLAEANVEIEVDGETPGTLPARVWVLPGAVRLRC